MHKPITISLPVETQEQLRAAAAKLDRPMSWVVNEALKAFFNPVAPMTPTIIPSVGVPAAGPSVITITPQWEAKPVEELHVDCQTFTSEPPAAEVTPDETQSSFEDFFGKT